MMAAVSFFFVSPGARTIGADDTYDALDILLAMKDSYSKNIESYTAVLVKGEPSLNKEMPPQKIYVKFQKPFKVYMKWVGEPYDGRELLYVQGQNNDNFFVKPDGFIGFFVRLVKLPSTFKTDESRYTVRDFGIGNLVDGIIDITIDAQKNNDLDLHCRGIVTRNGRQMYEIERLLPRKTGYRNQRLVLYVDTATNLPVETYAYDADGKLAEYCVYQDLTINPPMEDDEFSVHNKAYGFRYL
jgi:hypothetical protein